MLPWPAPYPAARSCRHVLGGSEPSLAALPHGASTEYKVLTAVLKPHRIAFPRSPSCALGSSLPGKLSTLPTPPGPLHWLLPLPGPTSPQRCACPPPPPRPSLEGGGLPQLPPSGMHAPCGPPRGSPLSCPVSAAPPVLGPMPCFRTACLGHKPSEAQAPAWSVHQSVSSA